MRQLERRRGGLGAPGRTPAAATHRAGPAVPVARLVGVLEAASGSSRADVELSLLVTKVRLQRVRRLFFLGGSFELLDSPEATLSAVRIKDARIEGQVPAAGGEAWHPPAS